MDTKALQESWDKVVQLGDPAAALFYATLFRIDQSLKAMFPPLMAGQRGKLLDALGYVVSNVEDGATLTAFVRQLGADHRKFDVRPEHYGPVGQALLRTLAAGLGDDWTPELEADWTTAYGIVSQTMIQAAKEREDIEPAYWSAEVIRHERRTGDIAVITVRPESVFRYRAGQSVSVEGPRRPTVWRYLSPANAPRRDQTIDFHIRSVAGGIFSPSIVYETRVGDVWRLASPIGQRLLVPPIRPGTPAPDLLLLAARTGLAPLKAIVEQMISELDDRRVTLVYGGEYQHDLYDLPALRDIAEQYRRITVLTSLSADPTADHRETLVETALRYGDWRDRDVYVCGSPGMTSGTCALLLDRGYDPDRIHVEPYNGDTYAPLREGLSPEGVTREVAGR